MFRRPHYIAIAAVFLLGLVLLSLPNSATTRLKLALSGFFLPLFGLASSTQSLTEQAAYSLRSKRSLLVELDRLRHENELLRVQAVQQTQLLEENDRLRAALGWQQQHSPRYKLARVTLRDPANWWRTLHINLGARDGVATNMPVLTPEGLVGRISQVGFASSQVVLIGDPKCQVSALVEEASGASTKNRKAASVAATGVVASGRSSILDPSIVDLTYVDRENSIKPGQRVLTSGLGGIFPRGLLVGQIVEATSAGFGLYTEARVKLSAHLTHLDEVWVLFP